MDKGQRIVGSCVLAALGAFFAGSVLQEQYSVNWFGQFCPSGGSDYCIHPEWLAVGAGLLFGAFAVYRGKLL